MAFLQPRALLHLRLKRVPAINVYLQHEAGAMMKSLVPMEVIEQKILPIRGEKVMFSPHLAELYRRKRKP